MTASVPEQGLLTGSIHPKRLLAIHGHSLIGGVGGSGGVTMGVVVRAETTCHSHDKGLQSALVGCREELESTAWPCEGSGEVNRDRNHRSESGQGGRDARVGSFPSIPCLGRRL